MEPRSGHATGLSGAGLSSHPSRRSLLAGAAACGLAAGMRWPSPAWAAGKSSVAGYVGSQLVSGVLSGIGGQAATFAIGQLMSVINPQPDLQAEMIKKLDQIIGQLKALQSSVDAVASGLVKSRYENIVKPAQTLVEHNDTLMDYYRGIANAKSADALTYAKAKFLGGAGFFDVHTAVETWHHTLAGFGQAPGLIQLWAEDVYQSNKLFGPATAKAIQDHWEFFDAQQTRTVMFLIDTMNFEQAVFKAGDAQDSVKVLRRWHEYRKTQLGLLRGTLEKTDAPFTYIDDAGKSQTETLPLNSLPLGLIIDRETNTVWLQNIDVFLPAASPLFGGYFVEASKRNCLWNGECPLWGLTCASNFEHLVSALGGSADHFYDAMKRAGFSFNNLPEAFLFMPMKLRFDNVYTPVGTIIYTPSLKRAAA